MTEQYFRLYCEICEFKKDVKSDFFAGLTEVKVKPLPGGVPKMDPESGEVFVPPTKERLRRFKCPQCGRVVFPKKIVDVQGEMDEKFDFEARTKKTHEKDWSERREDGVGGCPVPEDTPGGNETGDSGVSPEPNVQLQFRIPSQTPEDLPKTDI